MPAASGTPLSIERRTPNGAPAASSTASAAASAVFVAGCPGRLSTRPVTVAEPDAGPVLADGGDLVARGVEGLAEHVEADADIADAGRRARRSPNVHAIDFTPAASTAAPLRSASSRLSSARCRSITSANTAVAVGQRPAPLPKTCVHLALRIGDEEAIFLVARAGKRVRGRKCDDLDLGLDRSRRRAAGSVRPASAPRRARAPRGGLRNQTSRSECLAMRSAAAPRRTPRGPGSTACRRRHGRRRRRPDRLRRSRAPAPWPPRRRSSSPRRAGSAGNWRCRSSRPRSRRPSRPAGASVSRIGAPPPTAAEKRSSPPPRRRRREASHSAWRPPPCWR